MPDEHAVATSAATSAATSVAQQAGALYIGLMSGTSLDGVDAALVDFEHGAPRTLATYYAPFALELRAELALLQAPSENEIHHAALAANALVREYAAAVRALLTSAAVDATRVAAIGAHGQTVRHRPELGFTIQLNNPALLAELTGIAVVADFRSRDVAAGGQGAPLVPAFHQALFSNAGQHRVIVNIGGIANITNLPRSGQVSGFDTGPGNCLMDGWIAQRLGQPYDKSGQWAATGCVLPALLQVLLGEPYFELSPPKSTGRDLFHAAWLARHLTGSEAAADVQATLCALTARSIADAVLTASRAEPAEGKALDTTANSQDTTTTKTLDTNAKTEGVAAYVCGGGAHNLHLMAALRQVAPSIAWDVTGALGVPADWVEAVAFAWLARQTVIGKTGSLPGVTGARGARALGAIYPG